MSLPQPIFPEAGPSTDLYRPSLFDLLAQEQLRDLFHPVVRYVLSYFAQRYPRYLLRLLNHHEESFAFLLLLVERHHLKRHNASISEHFYSLRLSPSSPLPTPRLSQIEPPPASRRNLSRRQRWAMLLFLVGVPYLRARLQDYYERMGGGIDEMTGEDLPSGAVSRSQKVFRKVYPYANLALDVTFLGYDIAYLFEKTNSYRPWHTWLGLRVTRRGPEDEESPSTSLLSRLPPLLPPLLLLLKLSQWWYSPASPRAISPLTSSQHSTAATHAGILPPRALPILPSSGILPASSSSTPPAAPGESHEGGKEQDALGEDGVAAETRYEVGKETYGLCPLCGKKWQNPAVLPSGWVVCWRCGWDAVEGEDEDDDSGYEDDYDIVSDQGEKAEKETVSSEGKVKRRKGRCPITGVPVGPGELRRVLV
ncbi:hypothetical protein IAT38_007009 [Cryptococcus sp. DSM 104549]